MLASLAILHPLLPGPGGDTVKRWLASILTAALAAAISLAADAATIEYTLETSITAAYGSLPSGSPITITLRYDDGAEDAVPLILDTGAYDLILLSVSAAGETATLSDPIPATGSLNVLDSSFDRLSLIGISGATFGTASGSLGGVPVANMQVDLVDTSQSVFSSDAIPGAGLAAGDFTGFSGLLDDGLAVDQAPLGALTSLNGTVLPEPSTGWLLALGLGWTSARARRAAGSGSRPSLRAASL